MQNFSFFFLHLFLYHGGSLINLHYLPVRQLRPINIDGYGAAAEEEVDTGGARTPFKVCLPLFVCPALLWKWWLILFALGAAPPLPLLLTWCHADGTSGELIWINVARVLVHSDCFWGRNLLICVIYGGEGAVSIDEAAIKPFGFRITASQLVCCLSLFFLSVLSFSLSSLSSSA